MVRLAKFSVQTRCRCLPPGRREERNLARDSRHTFLYPAFGTTLPGLNVYSTGAVLDLFVIGRRSGGAEVYSTTGVSTVLPRHVAAPPRHDLPSPAKNILPFPSPRPNSVRGPCSAPRVRFEPKFGFGHHSSHVELFCNAACGVCARGVVLPSDRGLNILNIEKCEIEVAIRNS